MPVSQEAAVVAPDIQGKVRCGKKSGGRGLGKHPSELPKQGPLPRHLLPAPPHRPLRAEGTRVLSSVATPGLALYKHLWSLIQSRGEE